MPNLFKWLLAVGGLLLAVFLGFNIYTYFLVDYSLESLETALAAADKLDVAIAATDKQASEISPAANSVYKAIVDDVAMRELTRDEVDFKNLALLQMTSRSFSEASEKEGYKRAKIYLSQVTKSKKSERGKWLQILDRASSQLKGFYRSVYSIFDYFRRKIRPRTEQEEITPEYSNVLILGKAQAAEKDLDYKAAADLYRKYLNFYPDRDDVGFVTIALANVLIKQGRAEESRRMLKGVTAKYSGDEEGLIAERLLEKVNYLGSRIKLIERLKKMTGAENDVKIRLKYQLQTALAYLSIYRMDDAEKILKELVKNEDLGVRQKAKFYLGYLYKITNQYGASEKIFLELLDNPELAKELELGLHAELADIYYQKGDLKKSLEQYASLSEKAKTDIAGVDETIEKIEDQRLKREVIQEVWLALSEMEQATIYYFDLKDPKSARQHLDAAGNFLGPGLDFDSLKSSMEETSSIGLRDRAFKALAARQVGVAFELFTRNLMYHPDDAWTYAGLATVHLLLGDLDAAVEHAQKAHLLLDDEYTASMVGYVYGLNRRYDEAAQMYRAAFEKNNTYFPAQFNLACMLIKMREFDKALKILSGLQKDVGRLKIPESVQAKIMNNMGYAQWQMGDKQKAARNFEMAALLSPKYKIAERNLNASMERVPKLSQVKE